MIGVTVTRAGPLLTLQDHGRFGMLSHGVSASGPMDRAAFVQAGLLAGAGQGGLECTMSGFDFAVDKACRIGFAGGHFALAVNGQLQDWPGGLTLSAGDRVSIRPGDWGNYGYVRFGGDILAPLVGNSFATSSRVAIGGLVGKPLQAGDGFAVRPLNFAPIHTTSAQPETGPIRIIWGIHADRFPAPTRQAFLAAPFTISPRLDRMGVRLADPFGVFAETQSLSLVSDAMVPGDIQILGDGTPIVLMRDHQPTGGYPRIATVVTADLDRFAQLRPGTEVTFESVTVEHAHRLLRSVS